MQENIDFNKMLESISKMDKSELESKIKLAQTILNSKNIDTTNLSK